MEISFKTKTTPEPVFYVSRGDVGTRRQLSAFLDIPTSGYTIKMEGTKPSGGTFAETCQSMPGGFSVPVTEQMTDEPGITRAQVVLYGAAGTRIGSERVLILVEPLGGI